MKDLSIKAKLYQTLASRLSKTANMSSKEREDFIFNGKKEKLILRARDIIKEKQYEIDTLARGIALAEGGDIVPLRMYFERMDHPEKFNRFAQNMTPDPGYSAMPKELETPVPFGPPSPPKPATKLVSINPRIQQALRNAGYNLGVSGPEKNGVDGILGDLTRAALNKFKASKGLYGFSDEQLFSYILNNMNTGVANRQFPEEPKSPGSPVKPSGGPGLGGIGNTKGDAKESA